MKHVLLRADARAERTFRMTRAVPSPEELLLRAEKLAPVLAERVPRAAELRRIPDETIADFRDAGLFRILQPARYGGYELDPQLFFDVQFTLARACPSSAWVYGVLGVHAWQLALFAEQAQQDV